MSSADSTLPQSKSPSRRALLAGALGGLGAWAASAIGRASPTRATDGQPLVVGQVNTATQSTTLQNSTNNNYAFAASSSAGGIGISGGSASGWGVHGHSTSGVGVRAQSDSGPGLRAVSGSGVGVLGTSDGDIGISGISSVSAGISGSSGSGNGVHGFSNGAAGVVGLSNAASQAGIFGRSAADSTGIQGYSGNDSVPPAKPKTGVYGRAAQDAQSRGVVGEAPAGQGVRGETVTGAGVYAVSGSGGYAFRASGRVKIDKVSGVATISAGTTSETVSPGVNVTSGSFVLLTPKANLGLRALWFTTDATNNRFSIRMSKARTRPTSIAWLLLG